MKSFKVIKIFLFICVLIRVAESIAEDKWHKTEDAFVFVIETDCKYNWFEAWNACAVGNMTLVAIDTREKHNALNKILRNYFDKSPDLWIGGHDLGETNKFIWASTGKQFEFTNWSKGNPSSWINNSEHCVHIYDNSDFEWNDLRCSYKMGYICEVK